MRNDEEFEDFACQLLIERVGFQLFEHRDVYGIDEEWRLQFDNFADPDPVTRKWDSAVVDFVPDACGDIFSAKVLLSQEGDDQLATQATHVVRPRVESTTTTSHHMTRNYHGSHYNYM